MWEWIDKYIHLFLVCWIHFILIWKNTIFFERNSILKFSTIFLSVIVVCLCFERDNTLRWFLFSFTEICFYSFLSSSNTLFRHYSGSIKEKWWYAPAAMRWFRMDVWKFQWKTECKPENYSWILLQKVTSVIRLDMLYYLSLICNLALEYIFLLICKFTISTIGRKKSVIKNTS